MRKRVRNREIRSGIIEKNRGRDSPLVSQLDITPFKSINIIIINIIINNITVTIWYLFLVILHL